MLIQLLFEGKVVKAQTLARMALTSKPQYINPYLPGGYAWFFFENHTCGYSNYKRLLDLDKAVVTMHYECNQKGYKREYLTSHPDQVIAIHISCSQEKALNFSVNLNRRPYDGNTYVIKDKTIVMTGECGKEGIEFATVLSVDCKEGQTEVIGNFVNVQNATEATVYIATETNFKTSNYIDAAFEKVEHALSLGYERIKARHIKDYKKLFDKSKLILHGSICKEPTDVLIDQCRDGKDANYLMQLLYHFGRYLLIASSRKGCLPATLQGIWNNSYTPSWESNYTLNVNTQMNYWPAEISNLSECHDALFDFTERLCENGKIVAKEMYGCNGAVAHHISNIWAEAAPLGILDASPYWAMGLAWVSLHLYEHYKFTKDKTFLKNRCYPVIKEVALFFIDYLVSSPEGYLVTGPSVSPENSYISINKEVGALCMGPTMDIQIIKAVFEAVKTTEELLEIKDGLRQHLQKVEQKLPPVSIGKHGQIMEWYQDYEEVELGHRHISHLFGLYPGDQITKSKEPELFEAAKVTLKRRLEHGGGHTGWSKAWIINLYARLLNGEKAYENIRGLLNTSVRNSLLDVHPPFQIDGNFGVCAAIGEILKLYTINAQQVIDEQGNNLVIEKENDMIKIKTQKGGRYKFLVVS
ncbi:MAG: glycoside hydrolase N-terminal domain-containing protein [Cellulosilyticaceae bacterium]